MSEQLVGAWTPFGPVTPEEQVAFNTATEGLVGVGYVPEAVSTQVVAGMNYRFLCKATPAYPDAQPYPAMVSIYQPPNGQPHVTSITKL
jgi:hypothetical protein